MKLNLWQTERKHNMKFGIVFTSDYEIHGNGEGSPKDLMVEPTDRMMQLFNQYGAKLTIMADIGEIIRFGEHFQETGNDEFHYEEITTQLKTAVKSGHDVQLHIHPSYFNARNINGKWNQNWEEYSIADLPFERLNELVKAGKNFLEELLKPVKPDYTCFAFRAANWSMHPSANIVKALVSNTIAIDTSVFKYGKRTGRVTFDYTDAFNDAIPWTVDHTDVCKYDKQGKLLEFPIYSENRNIFAFLSPNRIFRLILEKMHPDQKYEPADLNENSANKAEEKKSVFTKIVSLFSDKHAWKMDFNQCTGKQLIAGLKRIEKKYSDFDKKVPVVLIGHSKIFTKINEKQLKPFLEYVRNNSDIYFFADFTDFNLNDYRLNPYSEN